MLAFDQLSLVADDLDATLSFYRALGLEISDETVWTTATGPHHVDVPMSGGFELSFDSRALAGVYNEGARNAPPARAGSVNVIGFRVESREAVDALHRKLDGLGYATAQKPFDTFFGARYAIVIDPDYNHVGIMSPIDPNRRTAPPDV